MSYIDQIQVDSTTYDIKDSYAQRKTIEGAGAPTTSTVGTLGVHYFNTSATAAPYEYICVDISNGSYTWEPVGSGTEMVVLSYGSSTWAQFEAAYNKNAIVYCKASSNSNPATGSQGRMAFMAFVSFSGTTMTSVEFQYYRSVSSHSDSQQGDQVYIYKLDKSAGWTVMVRESYTKIVAGNGLGSSYSNGVLTLTGNVRTVDGKTGAVSVIPTSGTAGQLLKKASSADYELEWGNESVSSVDGKTGTVTILPSGGTQGQVLQKASATDYDVAWANASGGDKVMVVTITYSSTTYNYSSNKTLAEIFTAIDNGYDVYLIYTGSYSGATHEIYQLYSRNIGSVYFNRVAVTNYYPPSIEQVLFQVTTYNNETRVYRSNNYAYVPEVRSQIYYVISYDGSTYSISDSNFSSIEDIDFMGGYYFGSVFACYGESGDYLPETSSYENRSDFYYLQKYWNTEEYNESESHYEPIGHAIFSKIDNTNGTVKLKSFLIEVSKWSSINDATVTYSEVSLGQAPSAQGVSF